MMTKVYELLLPLDSDERMRVISSTLTLLGEQQAGVTLGHGRTPSQESFGTPGLLSTAEGANPDVRVQRWMSQNGVPQSKLEEVFHLAGDSVELIASDVPGKSKREKTVNCYLLVGLRAFLSGAAKFSDNEALAFCQHMKAYDRNNHTENRKALGNKVSGGRAEGFTLSAPGLRAAAELLREL